MNCVILALGRKTASLHHALDKTVSRFQTLQILTLVPLLNPAMTLFIGLPKQPLTSCSTSVPNSSAIAWVWYVHPLQPLGNVFN